MELFISDLDGTLLNSKAEISEYTEKILNDLIENGLHFTVATARTYASAGKILKGLNLHLPIILMNGVLIYDPMDSQYCKVNTLDNVLCQLINTEKNRLGLDCFIYTIKGNDMMTYYERLSSQAMTDFYKERREKYYKSFTQVDTFENINDDVIYFTFINSREKLLPLYDILNKNPKLTVTFYNDIYSEDLWYLEVFSSKASKKNGVLFLKEKYNYEMISAFGDNTNDLPMFEVSDRKYAVANANKAVLEHCDKIIDSNENDGVAKFLLKLKGN